MDSTLLRHASRSSVESIDYFRQRHAIPRHGEMMPMLLLVEDFRELIAAPCNATLHQDEE